MPKFDQLKILDFLERRAILILSGLFLVSSVALIAICFWKYQHLRYDALDLGIYSQVVWNTAQGNWFAMSIHQASYLGDHFELYLLPLSLVYKIWADPRMLLIIQVLIINAAVFPFFILAHNFFSANGTTNRPASLALLVGWIYLLNPLVVTAILFEWHVISLMVLPFALALMFAERGNYKATMIWLGASLLVREDAASVVALAGLGVWLIFPKVRAQNLWRWTLPPLIASICWFVLATYLVSTFSPTQDYKFVGFASKLTGNYLETVQYLLVHPWLLFENLWSWNHPQTLIALFIPSVLLPFLAYSSLLFGVLPFLEFALVNPNSKQLLTSHYGILFIAPNIIGTIVALSYLKKLRSDQKILKKISNINAQIGTQIVILLLVFSPVYGLAMQSELRNLNPDYKQGEANKFTEDALWEAANYLQSKDNIVVPKRILNNLAHRPHIYPELYVRRGTHQLSDAPYVVPSPVSALVLDESVAYSLGTWYQGKLIFLTPATVGNNLTNFITEHGLAPTWQRDGVAMFESSDQRPTIKLTEALEYRPATSRPLNNKASLAIDVSVESNGLIDLHVDLSLVQPYPELSHWEVMFLDDRGREVGQHRLVPAWGLKAVSEWPLHQTVRTNYNLTKPTSAKFIKIVPIEKDKFGIIVEDNSPNYRLVPLP